jgi:hypothetical protein
VGDGGLAAQALRHLGYVELLLGDAPAARARYVEALATARRAADGRETAWALAYLAAWHLSQGAPGPARALAEASLAASRATGDTGGVALALGLLGRAAAARGEYGTARRYARESLAAYGRLRSAFGVTAQGLADLGDLARAQGAAAAARAHYQDALAAARRAGEPLFVAETLQRCAGLCAAQGRLERAARLFGAVAAWRRETGLAVLPFPPGQLERDAAATRAGLGATAFATAWAAGQATPLEQAIAVALEEDTDPA